METLEEAVKRLIKEKYGSIPHFAEKIDMPVTSVYNALSRGLKNTRTELTDRIYRELNIDWDTARLDGFKGLRLKNEQKNPFIEVPLYGAIATGTPIEMIPTAGTFSMPVQIHDKYPDAFLLRVSGESMNKILPDGCYALVDPCDEIERDNQPYAICVNGYDATIKRVHKLANGFELVPDSTDPTYKSKIYDYGEPGTEHITVIGRVVYHVIPFDWTY